LLQERVFDIGEGSFSYAEGASSGPSLVLLQCILGALWMPQRVVIGEGKGTCGQCRMGSGSGSCLCSEDKKAEHAAPCRLDQEAESPSLINPVRPHFPKAAKQRVFVSTAHPAARPGRFRSVARFSLLQGGDAYARRWLASPLGARAEVACLLALSSV
jgi:hypothetical protein